MFVPDHLTVYNVRVEISGFARRRMEARGITEEEVQACLENRKPEYSVGIDTCVYTREFSTGGMLKVRVKNNPEALVVDAFVVSQSQEGAHHVAD